MRAGNTANKKIMAISGGFGETRKNGVGHRLINMIFKATV